MYKAKADLEDWQRILRLDARTGEITDDINVPSKFTGVKDSSRIKLPFIKQHSANWALLAKLTTDKEYKIASLLSSRIKITTNSLAPLNDDTTIKFLMKEFDISFRATKKIFDKLFKLGVYGKFEYYDYNEKHTKYWVFNPYLSSNGSTTKDNVISLFENSLFGKLTQSQE